MSTLIYHCPHCNGAAEVAEEHAGANVVCPHCGQHFFASAPDPSGGSTQAASEAPIPFFKFSRRKLLDKLHAELVRDGDYSAEDHEKLLAEARRLELGPDDLKEVCRKSAQKALDSILKQVGRSGHLTDSDQQEIDRLSEMYGATVSLDATAAKARLLYLIEVKNQVPPPQDVSVILGRSEFARFQVLSTWAQDRRQISWTGSRSVAPTALSNGVLYVTDKRLLFDGAGRNTSITFGRLTGIQAFTDCVMVDKSTGKPDYFTMNLMDARIVASLARLLATR